MLAPLQNYFKDITVFYLQILKVQFKEFCVMTFQIHHNFQKPDSSSLFTVLTHCQFSVHFVSYILSSEVTTLQIYKYTHVSPKPKREIISLLYGHFIFSLMN